MSGTITGAQMRAIRALKKMTQAKLSATSGVSATAIAEFESGKRELRTSTISKLCDVLGVKAVYTVDGMEISEI